MNGEQIFSITLLGALDAESVRGPFRVPLCALSHAQIYIRASVFNACAGCCLKMLFLMAHKKGFLVLLLIYSMKIPYHVICLVKSLSGIHVRTQPSSLDPSCAAAFLFLSAAIQHTLRLCVIGWLLKCDL
jgi:hypothetical protein